MANPCADDPPPAIPDKPWTMFDLTNWKLTLPIGSSGKPTEIKQPTLNTWRDPNYFYVNGAGDAVVFKCPGKGTTTPNSKNPRTELREMKDGGKNLASWSASSGTHTMIVQQKIIAAAHPVVVGQVHGGDDDICVFRYSGGHLYATDGDDPTATDIGALALNTSFEAKFIASGGEIKMYFNGVLKATRGGDSSCYFKIGCYNQSKGASGDAQTEVSALTVTHT